MDKLYSFLLLLTLFIFSFPILSSAQNNLTVSFLDASSIPDDLNLCGDEDQAVVRIGLAGTSPDTRSNLTATLHLFKGVNFMGLDAASTSAGITVLDATDPENPVFSIPDLNPSGTSFVELGYNIMAACEVLDTLNVNGGALVFDTWEFNYDLGGNILQESDNSIEYRDAFEIPFFTIGVGGNTPAASVGDCMSRDIFITNSGLDGTTDSIFYSNTQSPGVYVSTITVNGDPIAFTKALDVNGDTLITAAIPSFYINNNTIAGGPSNGDGLFDPGETMTVTENICVTSCSDARTSLHESSWGCLGRSCDVESIEDFIRIGEGAANVVITRSGLLPDQDAGYCQTGNVTLTFENDGIELDAGFATMIDVELGVGLGNLIGLSDGGYTITEVRVNGVTITTPQPLVVLNMNGQFSSDPDGAGGLDDFDGDGFFDDLPLGESIELNIFFDFDCSIAQGTDDFCINDFTTSFTGRINYLSQSCKEPASIFENSFYRPVNTNEEIENFSTPDAFADGDVFFLFHNHDRSVRSFARNCSGASVFEIMIELPTGVTPDLTQTTMFKNQTSTPVALVNSQVVGNMWTLTYDAFSDVLNGNYALTMAFAADCTVDLGASSFPFTWNFYCPDCDCTHTWYCNNLAGPHMHKTVPPCAPDPALTCPAGLKTTAFDINRTSFGFQDNAYMVPFDPALANEKVAVTCDSVEMVVQSEVGETPLNGAIGFSIDYGNTNGTDDLEEIFLFSQGVVEINSGGTDYTCPVTPADLTVTQVGGTKTLRFELPNCLSDLGITLQPGDIVNFTGDFTVNVDAPIEVQFLKIPDIRANAFAVIAGVDESCDSFGDIFTVARINTIFAFPSSNTFPIGCEETFLNYQVISQYAAFDEYYGTELYPSIKVDSISFVFDPEVLNGFGQFIPEVSIPGHPIHGDDYFPAPGFENFPDGNYIATYDTLFVVPSLNVTRSFAFNFRVRVIPGCNSIFGSANGDNIFDFDPTVSYQNRYYASLIGDPSCLEMREETVDNDLVYTDPPTFSFSPQTNPDYTLFGDTAMWEVQMCNTSFDADAGLTWIAVENIAGDIEVTSFEDVSDPANITNLPFNTYGSTGYNAFAYTPALSRADGSAPLNEICNTIRIKALVNRCGILNLNARTGWNCIAYSDVNFTPETYAPCEDFIIPLRVVTTDPFLDANVVDQPAAPLDLCEPLSITILVRNDDIGAAFDLNTQLTVPLEGASIVPGSVEIAYPSDAAFQAAVGDPTLVGPTPRGVVYEYTDFSQLHAGLDQNGLDGFDPVDPASTDNEFRIRYEIVTDCDFTSGSLAYYYFRGVKGCQDSTNIEVGETFPINLNGAATSADKLYSVGFSNGSALTPNASSQLGISVMNLSGNLSDSSTDKIKLTLPPGISYDASSTVTTSTPLVMGEPTIDNSSGMQVILWDIPDGMFTNDEVIFTFSLTSPDYDCEITSQDVMLSAVFEQTFTCVSDASSCLGQTIVSPSGGEFIALPVNQGNFVISINSMTSSCTAGNQEEVTFSGTIINGVEDFPADPFNIDYFYDSDGNGAYDVGEPSLGTFTETGPILANQTLSFTHTFNIDPSQACGIIFYTDVTSSITGDCGVTELFMPDPQLLNAGSDLFACNNETTLTETLGSADCTSTDYTYNWTAVAPADISQLSDNSIATPDLTIDIATMTGTYIYILETNRAGCGTTLDSVVVNLSNPPTLSVNQVGAGVICAGATVQLEALGADTYIWADSMDFSILEPNNDTLTFMPTNDMTIALIGTDINGCTDTLYYNLLLQDGPTISVTESSGGTVLGCIGSDLTLNATGALNYVWEDLSNSMITNGPSLTFTPTGPTNIQVTGTDINGCQSSTIITVTIDPAACPCLPATVNSAISVMATCGNSDGSALISLAGNPADYTYTWTPDNGTSVGDGNERTGLPMGGYTIRITNTDDASCSIEAFVSVSNEDGPQATFIKTPATCSAADGTATLSPANFTYTWSDAGTGAIRNDLASGMYFVTFSDPANPTCENVLTIMIDEDNTLVADAVVNNNPTCGVSDGDVTLNVSGGSGNYSFLWADGDTNQNRTDLTDGLYAVTITDNGASGCELPFLFVLIADVPMAAVTILDTMDVTCNGLSDGGIDFTINYDPSFNGTPDTIITNSFSTFTNGTLSSGAYCIEIVDGNGCTAGGGCFKIVEPSPITTTIEMTPSCSGGGTASVVAQGGTPPYQYDWSNIPGDDNSNILFNLEEGSISVDITDANGCTLTESDILIPECPCIAVEITSTSIVEATCGNSDGTATVNLIGNPSDYDYAWSPDIGMTVGAGESRTNLPFGVYMVTVSNNNDIRCTQISIITVTNSDGPDATVSTTPASCNAADGSATLSPDTLVYTWEDSFEGFTRSDLTSGVHIVTYIDPANPDCPNAIEVFIQEDNPLMGEATVNAQPDCGASNGSVSVSATGGVGPYTYVWEDAVTGADRTDLASGLYVVTITDTGGTGCELPFIFVLTDDVPPANITITDTMDVSCAGLADGSIVFNVDYDPSFTNPPTIDISDGIFTYENGFMPDGNYCIVINDGNGCVAGGACFTIDEPDSLEIEFITTTDCSPGGSVITNVTGGRPPYNYDWSDLSGTDNMANRDSLPEDSYTLTVSDNSSCSLETVLIITACSDTACDFFNGQDTVFATSIGCNNAAEVCLDIPFTVIDSFGIFVDGVEYADEIAGCDFDTASMYFYGLLFGAGNSGPYDIISWPINDTVYTGTFQDIPDLVNFMNTTDSTGNWVQDANSFGILGGNNNFTYGQMDVVVTNLSVESFLAFDITLTPQGSYILVDTGQHEILLIDSTTMCTDSVIAMIDCMELTDCDYFGGIDSTIYEATICGDLQQYCIDSISLDSLNTFNILMDGDPYAFEIGDCNFDSTIMYNYGLLFGQGNSGPYDINSWMVNGIDFTGTFNSMQELVDFMNMNDPTGNWILDEPSLSINGGNPSTTYSGIDITTTSVSVNNLITPDFTLNPYGSYIQVDTGFHEIVFISPEGCSDTLYITVDDSELECDVVIDTIMPYDTVTHCIDTMMLELEGMLTSVTNVCPELGDGSVDFMLFDTSYCVTYAGLTLGQDTACIEFCDDMGFCDTINFYITVASQTDVIIDSIFVNQTDTFCFDTTIFQGNMITFENFCTDLETGNTDFFLDPTTYCAEYTGIESGKDTACIVLCDDLGYCDTTMFCLFVTEFDNDPTVNDDFDTTMISTPVTINVKMNDTILGDIDTIFILDEPIYGEAFFNLDCTVTYNPDDEICDVTDELTYVVCNENGCDTASVFIYIDCAGEIIVFNAMSPNGDGANDVFFIGGIEAYPNNQLCVFNRWGNQVYLKDSYRNDWTGTWDNNKELPDGTYFYVLRLNDQDDRVYSGYIEMYR